MKKVTKEDKQAYFAIAITFIGAGLVFFLNDSMRTIGIAFVVIGITFLTLSMGDKSKKR